MPHHSASHLPYGCAGPGYQFRAPRLITSESHRIVITYAEDPDHFFFRSADSPDFHRTAELDKVYGGKNSQAEFQVPSCCARKDQVVAALVGSRAIPSIRFVGRLNVCFNYVPSRRLVGP